MRQLNNEGELPPIGRNYSPPKFDNPFLNASPPFFGGNLQRYPLKMRDAESHRIGRSRPKRCIARKEVRKREQKQQEKEQIKEKKLQSLQSNWLNEKGL